MDGGTQASLTPSPPSLTETDLFNQLRLLRSSRVGIVTYNRLMAEHGTAAEALHALPDIARAAGVDRYTPCPEPVIETELRAARKMGAIALWQGQKGYPQALDDLEDAPPMLWARGNVALTARPCAALIGARNASSLGLRMTRRLAAELGAEGNIITSGLARGIDAAAHEAALDSGTIAVLGGGVDITYPRENAALQDQIAESGLLLSEQPMGLKPIARHFPRRNRLISGLSRAVIVVEAAAKSGSLMTARIALDQGREVMAVPGHPFDARASGCNMLIRDGATLVRGAQDVLESLGPGELPLPAAPAPSHQAAPEPTGSLTTRILTVLGPTPQPEDALLREAGIDARAGSEALLELELSGAIERHPGGLVSRAVDA